MSRPLLLVCALFLLACRPSTAPPAPVSPGDKSERTLTQGPLLVDAKRMLRDVEALAHDDLQGRYTLGEGLEAAARLLSQRHRALGLAPMGEDYQIPFSLAVGARRDGPQRLILHQRARARELPESAFVPARISASATARGPLVFAGYAAVAPAGAVGTPRDEAAVDPPKEAAEGARGESAQGETRGAPAAAGESAPGYNDLEGLALTGKVALILAHAPNLPDIGQLFRVLQEVADGFEIAARPLVAAGEEKAMTELHRATRERLAELLAPFLQGRPLPAAFWEVDDPMKGEIDLLRLLSPLLAEHQGPRFDPREHSLSRKVARLEAAGAVAVIVVEGPRSKIGSEARERDLLPPLADEQPSVLPERAGIPVVAMSWREADRWLRIGGQRLSTVQAKIDRELRPRSRAIPGVEVEVETRLAYDSREIPNVVAQIRGSDLADELVVVGAHYDHIGTHALGSECRPRERKGVVDEICNGADDNASGTAMLLELARAFQESRVRPRRTLVFAHFAGEELGLLGSHALADDPPFARDKVIAMINLDMVGRLGGHGLYVGGVATSSAWMPLLDELGTRGMTVTYDGLVTRRSDQASFYRHRIPVLFFFTGMHADYHRAGDHAARINVDGLASVGGLVGDLVWALAQGRPVPYAPPEEGDGLTDQLPGQGEVVKTVDAPATPIR